MEWDRVFFIISSRDSASYTCKAVSIIYIVGLTLRPLTQKDHQMGNIINLLPSWLGKIFHFEKISYEMLKTSRNCGFK